MNSSNEETFVVQHKYTRNSAAEEIIGIALKNNMAVFGGYVRDRDILGMKKFNDIDLVYFKNTNYNNVISMINACGYMKEMYQNRGLPYGIMSEIIVSVIKVKIIGINGKLFPESMHFSIDFVRCKDHFFQGETTLANWRCKEDTDFSCNLFYKDISGIHLRYVPKNIYIGNVDPFTFWKNMTISRKFYPVLGNIDVLNNSQLFKLRSRSTKFVKNGWKMMYIPESPFTIGLYRNIKLKDRSECSVCLTNFKNKSIIANTSCKHSFCNDCIQSVMLHTRVDSVPCCPNCRTCFSKNQNQFSDID